MARPKTISDERLLDIARGLFEKSGHTVTTREIAEEAGISEAILYQRFASKDELFFAAMRPTGPDIDAILGPPDPIESADVYLAKAMIRIGKHLAEVIPLALRVMTHPSFDPTTLSKSQPMASMLIREALTTRLDRLADRKQISVKSTKATAKLLVSLAHDWALGSAIAMNTKREGELREMFEVVWKGLRPD
jgi:AcrR family transcriptional regulator